MQERWPAGQTQRAEARAYQSTAIMTAEAFTTTVTWPLALMPSSSTASLVIEEVTIWPPPISTRTCEVVAPFLTSTTVPLIWLRALMRMANPYMVFPAGRSASTNWEGGISSPDPKLRSLLRRDDFRP